MKRIIVFFLTLFFTGTAAAQNIRIIIADSGGYTVPNSMLGVNTESVFQYRSNTWKRFLDPSTGFTTFFSGFTDSVKKLNFQSYYYPGGSVARLYHYAAGNHGYGLYHDEAVFMDTKFNDNHNYWGTIDESHDIENQYKFENDSLFIVPHQLPPPYVDSHSLLCNLNGASTVISVNVLWWHPSELKLILDGFHERGVPVQAVVMGTEVDNRGDSVLLPGGVTDYIIRADSFVDVMRNPDNPFYESWYATIPIVFNGANEGADNFSIWNSPLSQHISTGLGLPKITAINWWWYPKNCFKPNKFPDQCMKDYFNSIPDRIAAYKTYYDKMYVVQYGIKPSDTFNYKNTFVTGLFPMKNLFGMIDYNALNGEFFAGAYFFKLASASAYDPFWDDSQTLPVEFNSSPATDAFQLIREIVSTKYHHPQTQAITGSAHAESFFFSHPDSCKGKLYVINYSGIADTIRNIEYDGNNVTGEIGVRSIYADSLLAFRTNVSPIKYSTQQSLTGEYAIVVPGYSMLLIDVKLPAYHLSLIQYGPSICLGQSTTLSVSGALSYSWLPSTGLTETSGSGITAHPESTTTYTVTGINASGCIAVDSTTVTVNALPQPVINGDTVICLGDTITLEAEQDYISYFWSDESVNASIDIAEPGIFTLSVIDVNGCTGSGIIEVAQKFTPVIEGNDSICSGFTSLFSVAGNYQSFNWSTGDTTSFITVSEPQLYSVLVIDSAGCEAMAYRSLSFANPQPQISGSEFICEATAVALDAGSGYLHYQWSTGDTVQTVSLANVGYAAVTVTNNKNCLGSDTILMIGKNNPIPEITGDDSICSGSVVTWTTVVSYATYHWSNLDTISGTLLFLPGTYTVSVTDSFGCAGSDSATLYVLDNPSPHISGQDSICEETSIQLFAEEGFSNYQWSTDDTTSTVEIHAAGQYSVSVIDMNGCSGNDTLSVYPRLVPIISGNNAICEGDTALLYAEEGYFHYLWSSGDTTSIIKATVSGIYSVTVIDSAGCIGSSSINLTVHPIPVVNISGLNIICAGNSTTFSAGIGFSSYLWSNGTTGSIVALSLPGIYAVTVTDPNGCIGTNSRTLTIDSVSTISVSPVISSICFGDTIHFTVTGASSYIWSPTIQLSATSGDAVDVYPAINTTYTVLGINEEGCSPYEILPITVNSLPEVTFTPPVATICSGNNISISASGGSSYVWSPATALNTISGNTVIASPVVSQIYHVTGTDTLGCSSTSDVTVSVNAKPLITISPAQPAICAGASKVLTASGGTSYTWSPSTGLNVTTGSTVTAQPAVTTTYTITGFNAFGCSATTTVTLTINPLPVVTVDPSSAAICKGFSTNLTAAGAATYTWATSGGLNVTTGANVVASPANTKTYTLVGTSNTGCSSVTTVTVIVNALPVVSINPAAITICQGNSTDLTAAGALNYTWAPQSSLNSTTGNIVNASPGTTKTFTVTGTNAAGCSATAQSVITVRPKPPAAVSPSVVSYCPDGSATLIASGGVSYSWTPSAGLNVTTGSTVVASPNSNRTYTVTCTDAFGCTATATSKITVNVNPTLAITPSSAQICIGGNVTLTASGASTYSWSPSAGLSVTTGASVLANPSITTTYTVTGINATGCTATATRLVTVNPNPSVTVNPASPSICIGSGTLLTASGASIYNWLPSTGLNITSGAVVTATPLVTTSYTVTGTNTFGCSASQFTVVTVNSLPVLNVLSQPSTICQGVSSTLSASGAMTYSWSPPLAGLNVVVGDVVIATPFSNTTYQVTGTNAEGCESTASVNINVLQNPTPSITGEHAVCSGFAASLNTQSGYASYLWSNGSTAQSISVGTAGDYSLTVTAENGCSGSTSHSLAILPLPAPVITGVNAICSGTNATLDAGDGYNSYQWSTSATTQTLAVSSEGNYSVTVTDANGCSGSASHTLAILPLPSPLIDGADSICTGTNTTLDAGTGYTSYLWSTGEATQMIFAVAEGNYSVTVTDSNNCAGTISKSISYFESLNPTVNGADTICAGSSTTLYASDGFSSYLWSTGSTSQSILVASAGNYAVQVMDQHGCIANAAFTISVISGDPVIITPSSAAICEGDSATLIASNGNTFSWEPLTGLSSISGSSVVVNPETTTTYTVSGTSEYGCLTSGFVTITVNPVPVVMVDPAQAVICSGNNVSLIASGAQQFSWIPATGLNTSSEAAVIANPESTTTYNVTGITAEGCIDTATVQVTVNSKPVVSVNPSAVIICRGSSILLTASNALTYSWSPSNALNATTGESVTATPVVTTNYTVTGTDSVGCSATAEMEVTVNEDTLYYEDADNDMYGNAAVAQISCLGQPSGYVSNSTDCNDAAPGIHPDAAEICFNGIDDNCNSEEDEGCVTSFVFEVKFFIQGYMDEFNPGFMKPVLSNENIGVDLAEVDTVTIRLHDEAGYETIDSFSGLLHADGMISCTFFNVAHNSSYYISIHYKNTLETWSAAAVSMNDSSYDFSSDVLQAYPDPFNPNPQMTFIAGIWAIYSGDIDQNGSIDGGDFNAMEPDVTFPNFGYNIADITGDGIPDGQDYNLLEPNVALGLFVARP